MRSYTWRRSGKYPATRSSIQLREVHWIPRRRGSSQKRTAREWERYARMIRLHARVRREMIDNSGEARLTKIESKHFRATTIGIAVVAAHRKARPGGAGRPPRSNSRTAAVRPIPFPKGRKRLPAEISDEWSFTHLRRRSHGCRNVGGESREVKGQITGARFGPRFMVPISVRKLYMWRHGWSAVRAARARISHHI